jgi:hypothetical protein
MEVAAEPASGGAEPAFECVNAGGHDVRLLLRCGHNDSSAVLYCQHGTLRRRFRHRRKEVSARHRSGRLVVAVAEYRNRDGASAPAVEFETSAWDDGCFSYLKRLVLVAEIEELCAAV